MAQSPELAGGEGFTFGDYVAAFYLSALLAEGYAPGIENRTVVQVSVTQRDCGEPLDDVIVDFEDFEKEPARLSLQVKRSLTISAAKSNKDFRDIIGDSWATLNKPNFRTKVDRYGAAVGTVTPSKERALKKLCAFARESLTADHFDARFVKDGNASKALKSVRDDIVALLKAAKGTTCTIEEVHKFLTHFVLIQFDFLSEGAIDPPRALNQIRDCLASTNANQTPFVWSRFLQLARESAGKSGQIDRARLVHSISPLVRLRGATSLHLDLDKLTELATSLVNFIPDDIGGTKLDRSSLLEELDAKGTTARVTQICGLPGSGKSVVMRRAVQRALETGPTLFLKAEQLEGTNWASYANLQGLSGTSLEHLLVEIAATGTPILFIDAIDRIEKEHQPIILDVINAIVKSPLLDNWRVVVSLRDTGIEVLRNWLGEFLDVLKVKKLSVGQLNDEEAATLAKAQPNLRPLLFGSAQVREIVRRPFFAKVVNQSLVNNTNVPTFFPRSEIDLIENWWLQGGYNAVGQLAIERQRALLELALARVRQLCQPIRLSMLTSVAYIDDLKSDGILQNAREGVSVRFAHDIFFEWAFFHVLADRGPKWMEEIKACGEPPAVARVVELTAQWEYSKGKDWSSSLARAEAEGSIIRSQWLRAWLVGPLGTFSFEIDDSQFEHAVFADDFRLFRKVLVWFQAVKTSPNSNILEGTLKQEKPQQIAYLLGWPSDFHAWRRLIDFIHRRISMIPKSLYQEIVAIFEVWQNALSGYRNSTSRALLQQCASWLAAIDAARTANRSLKYNSHWENVPDTDAFRNSLCQIILRSSLAEPTFAADYLQRASNSERISEDVYHDIITWSPALCRSLPQLVVELSLAYLRKELPDDIFARQQQKLIDESELRKAALAKSEAERSTQEKLVVESHFLSGTIDVFSDHDWERYLIHHDYRSFWPPSPRKEPFHSLFQTTPEHALQLLRALCNHAMTSWRQLHRYSPDLRGTPIPLEITFPWGSQRFWGTDREYLWFRSTWAPNAIGCGFMALEEWCLAEIVRGRLVDELIEQIVKGNECIAILGIASMLALHTEMVSEATLPLFTSQRLLTADFNRMEQEFTSSSKLIGFMQETDKPHFEAVKTANELPVRKKQLVDMYPKIIFASKPIWIRARDALLNFKNDLPFQYEEHRNIPAAQAHLTAHALKYAELADLKNYRTCRMKEDSEQFAIFHVSPSASEPENVARVEKASNMLNQTGLCTWACKSFDEKRLVDSFTLERAIVLAREADAVDLFDPSKMESEGESLNIRRGAVTGTAAIALNFRKGCTQKDLLWARDVLRRAICLPEKYDHLWCPSSLSPWHPATFAARGLAAELREGTGALGSAHNLLQLIAHPIESVSLAALEEAGKLWFNDPKLTWAALILAFSLCHLPPRPISQPRQPNEPLHSLTEAQAMVEVALNFYANGYGWAPLPLPPPPWVKVEPGTGQRLRRIYTVNKAGDPSEAREMWGEPDVFWHSKQAAKILEQIPFAEVLSSGARSMLLDFLDGVLDWTNKKNSPPWVKPGCRDRLESRYFEWTRVLGSKLGLVAGLVPLSDFQARFLGPILALEGENCWALLSPFASSYVCSYVYDAPVVPTDAIEILDLCLERLLQGSEFKRDTNRSGKFSGINKPELVRVLMFVSVERADMAARYVNGDWSEISRILPVIDRFIRAGGWAACVMGPFLTLCERSRVNYPAEKFADQVLAVIGDGPEALRGWQGSFIPARIAELVHHFAHRDAPMAYSLAQKFLRILDLLVDMGDRRSAALQLSEAFREISLLP